MKGRNTIAVAVFSALLLAAAGCVPLAIGAAGGAAAGGVETARRDRPEYGAGTYAATILSNTVYVPAKVIFAGAGGLTSGLAYLVSLGNREVSGDIWDASVGGNYVVTPEMIEGRQPVRFIG